MENHLCRFLTLTLDPSTCTPEQSIAYIRTCWNKFRTYLTRRYGTAISFISVLEIQQSGYAHLHVLVDRFIPQSWISEAWEALGGGRIVDIRYVDVHRVSAYLSKYLTKKMLLAGFGKRQRRYTTSRNITLLKRIKSEGWTFIKAPLEFVRHHYERRVIHDCYGEHNLLQSFLYWDPLHGDSNGAFTKHGDIYIAA